MNNNGEVRNKLVSSTLQCKLLYIVCSMLLIIILPLFCLCFGRINDVEKIISNTAFFITLLISIGIGIVIIRLHKPISTKRFTISIESISPLLYIGTLILLLSWIAAWSRFPFLSVIQAHTFIPLWLGYILFANGLQQTLFHRSHHFNNSLNFAIQFPISAALWWVFEYLNRYSQNWIYQGIEHFSSLEYACFATISFSTVLPALHATKELCSNMIFITHGWNRPEMSLNWLKSKYFYCFLLLTGTLPLGLLGLFPSILFPCVWISPLCIMLLVENAITSDSLITQSSQGKWDQVIAWGMAGLCCGLLWEMWNYYSYARWIYIIPYVPHFKIFEMPLLGYLGYIPFGVLCGIIIKLISQPRSQ
jgi:hypothetical protein